MKNKMGLTAKQLTYLNLVIEYIAKHEVSPTYQELGELTGTSTKSSWEMAFRLEERGHLTSLVGRARSMTVV